MNVHIDFLTDLRNIWISELKTFCESLGVEYRVPDDLDVALVGRHRFNVAGRLIGAWPRRVHQSRELLLRRLPYETKAVLEQVVRDLETGTSVHRRLSRKIRLPEFTDLVFENLGINHLHLGDDQPDEPLSRSSADLLFLWVTDTDAFLLDVRGHATFNDPGNLGEIGPRNWPEAFKHCELVNVAPTPEEHRFKGAQQANLWRLGATTAVQANGKVYLTGRGISTDAGASGPLWHAARELRRAKRLEEEARGRVEDFCVQAFTTLGHSPTSLEFHLKRMPEGGLGFSVVGL